MTSSFSQRVSHPILTRSSPLAVWQAEHVQSYLQEQFPSEAFPLHRLESEGDQTTHQPYIAGSGLGVGVFVKALEKALLQGQGVLAVHSLKDVPSVIPETLALLPFGERLWVKDAWLPRDGSTSWRNLPSGARVGSASRRRVAMMKALRPDLELVPVRGNLQTRLRKLQDPQENLDGLILAEAGLRRLGLDSLIMETFDPLTELLPACGQGLLAVEYSRDLQQTSPLLLQALRQATPQSVQELMMVERHTMAVLEGGCQLPAGIYAHSEDHRAASLTVWILSPDARLSLRETFEWGLAPNGESRFSAEEIPGLQAFLASLSKQPMLTQIKNQL